MVPSRQTALLASDVLPFIRRSIDTRFQICDAKRKILTLRLVLRRLLEGVSPDQINLYELDVPPVGIGAGEYLQGALSSLAHEALLHARAGVILFLYGAVRHNPRSGPLSDLEPLEDWCEAHDHSAGLVAATFQGLRYALAHFKASVRAVEMATTWYPRLSADWITLVRAAEQHAYHASIEVDLALNASCRMGLAVSLEHTFAEHLLADGDA